MAKPKTRSTNPAPEPAGTESEAPETKGTEAPEAESDTEPDASEPAPEPAPAATAEERAAARERERVSAIYRTAAALGIDRQRAEQAVGNPRLSADAFRAQAIDLYERSAQPHVRDTGRPDITPGEDAREKWVRGAGNWLLVRCGQARHVEKMLREKGKRVDLDPGEFRGMTLLDLARAALERSGVSTSRMSRMEIAGAALTMRATGYATTSDFPDLLETTLRTVLLAGYATAPDTWPLFCSQGQVSDFKEHTRLRLGTFGRLEKVNEVGEYRNKPWPTGRGEKVRADTKGNIVSLSRQAIINDDLGVFQGTARGLGRAAKLTIELDVYDLLALNGGLGPLMADGDTLFHANHGNIAAGAALTAAALDVDRQVLAEQTDESGNYFLTLDPAVLLVPSALRSKALTINTSETDPDNVGANTPNTMRETFDRIVATPRLTGTRRYMFADPDNAPVIEVVFLDGETEPDIDTEEGFRVDGVSWRVRLDYGVAAVDYRGAVTNAGAP